MSLQAQFESHGSDTREFSLDGLETAARVVGVYDGDTITAVIPFGGTYFKFQIRLRGIDAPEMKSKDKQLKTLARRARDRTFELITGQPLEASANDAQETTKKKFIKDYLEKRVVIARLRCGEQDKYGRVLADVRSDNENSRTLSEVLLEEKLVYPYFGETKLGEAQQTAVLC